MTARRFLATLALAALLPACGTSATTDAPGQSATDAPAQDAGDASADVTVTTCTVGEYGDATASLTITNPTDESQTYLVTVSGNGPDGTRLVELTAASNNIAPGQTAQTDALGFAEGLPADGLACVVADVQRLAL